MKRIIVTRSLTIIEERELVVSVLSNYFGNDYTFHLIYPEETNYKIAEIKKLTTKLARKSSNELEDVYVLMQCDRMSNICQNALLKTLEDSKYSLILVVGNLGALLPTIQSRCFVEYIETDKTNSSHSELILNDYDDISSVAKYERDKVRTMLVQMVNDSVQLNPDILLFYEEAIKKLDANCKIESILYELLSKIHVAK